MDDRNRTFPTPRGLAYILLSMLLAVAIGCRDSASGNDIAKVKYAGVSRAAKALEAGIAVGVTNPKLNDLMQNLYTEIYVARDQVSTEDEKTLLRQYEDAANVYLDSLRLWNKQEKGEIWVCAADVPKGAETMSDCVGRDPGNVVSIAQKYNLPIAMHQLKILSNLSMVHGTVPASSVQDIWKVGGQKLAACNAVLNASRP